MALIRLLRKPREVVQARDGVVREPELLERLRHRIEVLDLLDGVVSPNEPIAHKIVESPTKGRLYPGTRKGAVGMSSADGKPALLQQILTAVGM